MDADRLIEKLVDGVAGVINTVWRTTDESPETRVEPFGRQAAAFLSCAAVSCRRVIEAGNFLRLPMNVWGTPMRVPRFAKRDCNICLAGMDVALALRLLVRPDDLAATTVGVRFGALARLLCATTSDAITNRATLTSRCRTTWIGLALFKASPTSSLITFGTLEGESLHGRVGVIPAKNEL